MEDYTNVLKLSLVGLTDAGKTAVFRTLLRDSSLGEMTPEAGTTQQIQEHPLCQYDQNKGVFVSDTPGFQRLSDLRSRYLKNLLQRGTTSISDISDFLDHKLGDLSPTFIHDCISWKNIAVSDAVIAVIDASDDPVKPQYPYQTDLLYFLQLIQKEKPVLVLLNKIHLLNSKTDEWIEILKREQLPFIKYDANRLNINSEMKIFTCLGNSFPKYQGILNKKRIQRTEENRKHHETTLIEISKYLLRLAEIRVGGASLFDAHANNKPEQKIINIFATAEKTLVKLLTQIWGFNSTIVANSGVFPKHTRFVNRIRVSTSGRRIAIGAAIGAVADIPFMGLSFGSGSVIGAAAGGLFGKAYDMAAHKLYDSSPNPMFFVPDTDFLRLATIRSMGLYLILSERGHGAPVDEYNVIDLNKVLPNYIDPAVEFLQEKSKSRWPSSLLAIHKFMLKAVHNLFAFDTVDPSIAKLKQILASLYELPY